ncbi:MAG TPA: amidohydrolase [Gemmatimonadales bacterium]|nr:amidohydrolase [Gemmatimonadales bacterium]
MRYALIGWTLVCPALLAAQTRGATPAPAPAPADLVLQNARVYTVDDRRPTAQAIAIRGDTIAFVGSNAAVKRYIGPATRVLDLRGRTVVPGFTDAHAHLAGIGERELTLNLEGASGPAEVARRVAERVRSARPGEWITGLGWIETGWSPPRFLTRADLDSVAPNNPVYLSRADGHAGVANSAALRLAGITAETKPPAGGDILRDERGEPTGMLIDHAQALVEARIPPADAALLRQRLAVGAERSVRVGWTQLQDAGGPWDDVEALRSLYREGKIKLRVYKAVYGPGPAARRLLAEGPSIGEFGGRLTVRTIKAVLDGALGSRGAALLQPYADAPDKRGLVTTNVDSLRPMLREALRRGVQVETHAIGDRANRMLLDLYREAFDSVPRSARAVPDPRWRDEHTQIVAVADLPRFHQLGIIPSMQASHAIGDLHFVPKRLGLDRLAGAYAWGTLLRDGNIIAGGSDAPVERGEPMIEFYAAVARRDTSGFRGPEWHPEQAMTRAQALKSLTLWPAYAAFEEKRRGSITPGKWADLTVLSADIMRIPEPEILRTRVVMTIIGGEIAYQADEAATSAERRSGGQREDAQKPAS